MAHAGALGRRLTRTAAVRFPTLAALKLLAPSWSLSLRTLTQGLRLLSVALLMIAMTRPQTGRTQSRVVTQGIDIMLAIDTSGTMRALDLDAYRPIQMRRDRLKVVKDVVEEFVKKRDNDQIGMVVFGDEAFTQCPLTLDHGILATFLDHLEVGMAGDRTAIGSALGRATQRLEKSSAKSRVIVLLTDGRNNAGTLPPAKAAEVAKSLGIKIYTIGAGTRGQAPFIQDTVFGKQVVYEDVAIDEDALQQIAKTTGGAYFRAEDADGLERIYDQIDKLERTEIEMKQYMEYNERFAWFVTPALLLLLAEVVLLGTRLRKIP
ncbi:MAG: VWA domain-containing protein [Deltaproteobacteria bacterium]|nr:VWA domain-containing protein [Deltaproteobacteria bacterium]